MNGFDDTLFLEQLKKLPKIKTKYSISIETFMDYRFWGRY